ncbi:MAG: bifunctional phosphoribosyl-AMP cyclohydrolase/phosphoribosyl-ATP diphosphatase HisIE [Gemmatimonadota bacterium]
MRPRLSLDFDPDELRFPPGGGLLPAIVQSADHGGVLMLAWMNRPALDATLDTGRVTFYSRSRAELWEKGSTSGNWLELRSIRTDCDRDALLVTARAHGPTCHTGRRSCFDDGHMPGGEAAPGPGAPEFGAPELAASGLGETLERLARRIAHRAVARPTGSYTTSLLERGTVRTAQKVGEEAVEAILAAVSGSSRELAAESADLLYHLLVLWRSAGLEATSVAAELRRRESSADQRPEDT